MMGKGLTKWLIVIALIWAFNFFYAADNIGNYVFTIVMYAGINIILASSLNLINGITGQFSMGHAGFMSIGAYFSAFLSIKLRETAPDLLVQPFISDLVFIGVHIAGGLLAAVAGYAVGLPSLRLKGDYLAIVTLGFGEIIRVVLLNLDAVGAARGLPGIPKLSSFGWVYTFVVISVFSIWRIAHISQGRACLAVREDEVAAESMGVPTTKAKVRSFVIGSFFAGLAGGLFAHYLTYLNPSIFDYNRSFEIIIMVVLGGMGSISGAVIAALFLSILREALRPLQQITGVDLRMVIYSLALITLMLTRPKGIFGTSEIGDFFPESIRKKFLGERKVAES